MKKFTRRVSFFCCHNCNCFSGVRCTEMFAIVSSAILRVYCTLVEAEPKLKFEDQYKGLGAHSTVESDYKLLLLLIVCFAHQRELLVFF